MKKLFATLLVSLPMLASAASNCDEISQGIAQKIINNGVDASLFQLKQVPVEQAQQNVEGKIVGSCDVGRQNIVYVRLDGVATTEKTQANKEPVTTPAQPVEKQAEIKANDVIENTQSAAPQAQAPQAPAPQVPAAQVQ